MADVIRVEGLVEFIDDLRAAPRRIRHLQGEALKSGARKVVARAAGYAPKKTGDLGTKTSVRLTSRGVTITWVQPYAGVQEWAIDYTRGGIRGGSVHMSGATPPRFAFRARDELAGQIATDFLDAVARAAAAGGWFEVVG